MAKYYNPEGTPMTLLEWADAFEHAECQVGHDLLPNGLEVSTVWLGLDHNFGSGPPLIFETKVFGLPSDEKYQEYYSTLEDAQEGHKATIEWASRVDGPEEIKR